MNDIKQFMERFFQGVIQKQIEVIADTYAHDNRLFVFLEGPRSKTVGWENVRTGWEHYLASRISVQRIVWGDDLQVRDYGHSGWVAATNKITVAIGDGPPKTLEMRSTWLLEKRDGHWRIVHEHVSQPHPDPYGIGDWLVRE
jgi:ketosteroid isomerase-like protein